ncbi:MAG: amidohydrolase [Candidatus Bathyarchaeota archaeon]|nr:amidohydrolase [Candidatus Termiticorpusculum sp.]
MTSADLVLLDGNIITMNPKMPSAQAIAVKNGKIAYVGSNQKTKHYIDEKTHIIYLGGKTVLPGFIDTHAHVTDYGRLLTWLNLEKVSSIKEIQTKLTEYIKQVGTNKWVLGRALDSTGLLEGHLPSYHDLDVVSPDNPVVIYCKSGQVCVVNSKALVAANIYQQNDSGIEKNSTGEITGVLRDQATNFVWNLIPEPTLQELYDATELALKQFVQTGITNVHWIVLSEAEISVIQKLVENNSMLLRVYLIVSSQLLDLALQKLKHLENDYFKFGGAVIFADGYLSSRTAALFEPYSDSLSVKGSLLCQQNEMVLLADKIQQAGLQLVIHAVGDKAIQEAVNTIQQLNRNPNVPRPRIEQAAVLNSQLIQCIKKLEISVSIQPCVVASEFLFWSAEKRLGEKRMCWLFPVKKMLDCGILVSAGSDCPMEPLNPLFGVEAAVKRGDTQKVSVYEALQMYTVFAAQAALEFVDKGSIEQGKLADLIVLSNNPVSETIGEVSSVFVCFAVIGGTVFCSKN